ncbi:MAG: STAS domain-containing protein [Planctomycetes bacterium]|nr:STAS domain-containing protein [Planctomycetota bacterium]
MNPSPPFDSPFSLDIERAGRAHIVRLRGSASMDQVEDLHRRLVELIEPGVPHLVLELSELDFISSAGIGAIMAAHLKARAHEGTLRMVNPTPAIRNLLRLLHIDRQIGIDDTLASARAALDLD